EPLDGSHILFSTDERSRLDWQVVGRCIERLEGREISRGVRNEELKEMAGVFQVLEMMLPQILQSDSLRQIILHQFARRLGEQHLSPVPNAHDAGGVMDVPAAIAPSSA